jgi:transcriptional regulator with XRE-family HTH domain
MYKNLKAEQYRRNLKSREIAKAIGISERTYSNKRSCNSDFTITEAFAIRDKFFPGANLGELFKREELP